MSFDAAKNLAKVTLNSTYGSADTSVVLVAGDATKLPAAPFNATWWNASDYDDPTDDPFVEIVRVTAIVGSTLTVTRAQEGTSATAKNLTGRTYQMVAGFTAASYNAITAYLLGIIAVITTDPVGDPGQSVAFRLNKTSGSFWYWDSGQSNWYQLF